MSQQFKINMAKNQTYNLADAVELKIFSAHSSRRRTIKNQSFSNGKYPYS